MITIDKIEVENWPNATQKRQDSNSNLLHKVQ